MTALDPIAVFDLMLIPGFLDQATCSRLLNEIRSSAAAPATVYGRETAGGVDDRVRKALRHAPSIQTEELIRQQLSQLKPQVENHFKLSLNEIDPAQFLHYLPGDFFVAHQDGNTGLIRSDSEARRISVIILLNDQSDEGEQENTYAGGSLVFHDWKHGQGSAALPQPNAGTFVAFRAETTHEVTPITTGERFSIACWYR
ncbi:MAG TPA: 2OG-Fe(II) oxygenase [Pyrinomonadaceae bacterium]|nr:2OG-Fe(II) oxygenase [Pyrinomonadaceae bacterium]